MDEQILNKTNKLWDIYGLSNHQYTVTLTPKGNAKTHAELLNEFQEYIDTLKCVISYWLVAQTENTNHFHGVIQTSTDCKFIKTRSKNCLFKAYIEVHQPHFNKAWTKYCASKNPKTYYHWLRN